MIIKYQVIYLVARNVINSTGCELSFYSGWRNRIILLPSVRISFILNNLTDFPNQNDNMRLRQNAALRKYKSSEKVINILSLKNMSTC